MRADGADRVARLSEGQRECLRLVYRHMETKEIARILKLSPDGVTQRIKVAMRILASTGARMPALLAEAEKPQPTRHGTSPPIRRHLPHRLKAGGTAGLRERR